jgi:hypothetical protein
MHKEGSGKNSYIAKNSRLCRGIEGRVGVVEEIVVNGSNLGNKVEARKPPLLLVVYK